MKRVCSCYQHYLCLWGTAVVLPAPAPSFYAYSDVVGGKEDLQIISVRISSLRVLVASGRVLDAAQKQNFFVTSLVLQTSYVSNSFESEYIAEEMQQAPEACVQCILVHEATSGTAL